MVLLGVVLVIIGGSGKPLLLLRLNNTPPGVPKPPPGPPKPNKTKQKSRTTN